MLDESFVALQTFEWGQDPAVLRPIDDAVVATHGDTAARSALEQQLIAALAGAKTRAASDYLFRQLMVVGTAASVPALAQHLPGELSHLARYALERIPGPEAAKALREAVGRVAPAQKVGMIASLGSRRDADSVPVLAGLLKDEDLVVARAAATALGTIRTLDAAQALTDAASIATISDTVTHALLACADGLMADGQKVAALAIYKKLSGQNQPKHVRLAATRGMLSGVR